MLRHIEHFILVILLILFLAALPTIINVNNQSIDWNFELLPKVYQSFFSELSKGSLGTYQLGSQTRMISEDIGNNFWMSLKIVIVGVITSIIVSLLFGLFISRFWFTRIFNLLLNILSAIPDFILIVFSMVLAILFYKVTGIRIISFRPDAGPLNTWFPTLLIGISPTLYLFKNISVKYYQSSSEDYVRTGVSKGLSTHYLNTQHIYLNIEPFILSELKKVISIAIGNLFIVEYIMNVSGITKFIFQSNEIQPIAIGLFLILAISIIVFFSVRLLLYVFKRGFIHE
ncbi:ABC transporter permease subunit [Bacillus sp. 03113]|uniref:ABC transporter permease subunit n=1 Tax=Bacillus sp. 03113 TaxID=2578211 RepID=UPI0011438AC9|nr:ABC transporter permease subunit [Bacillus sp. 03113]